MNTLILYFCFGYVVADIIGRIKAKKRSKAQVLDIQQAFENRHRPQTAPSPASVQDEFDLDKIDLH